MRSRECNEAGTKNTRHTVRKIKQLNWSQLADDIHDYLGNLEVTLARSLDTTTT